MSRPRSGEPKEYLIPKGKHISVHEGDHVRAGEPLMDGSSNPHDILRVLGVKELAKYLVDEVQEVYRLQGVKINDKHIEIIVRQMLRRVRIKEVGDTHLLVDDQVERLVFEQENEKALCEGKRPAIAEPLLLGYHQGLALDRVLHLGRIVPGDHQGADPGGHRREDRLPARPQGKRHHGSSDPCRYRFGTLPASAATAREPEPSLKGL